MQGNGIGNSLIQFGINRCLEDHPDMKEITVSSSCAKVFYEKKGTKRLNCLYLGTR